MEKEPAAVSLFSGCGGLDLGLEQAGIEIALANDMWDVATTTYEDNFSNTAVTKDVNNMTKGDLLSQLNQDGYTKQDIDMVVGGPPCQGFSRLNNNEIELDEMEKDNRNTLFHEFVRLATSLNPSIILIENVRDLINRQASDGTYIKDHIVEELEENGYDCEYQVIKAEEHGVPQKRRRIFFVGTGTDYDKNPTELFPKPSTGSPQTAGDALDGINDTLPNMNYTNSQDSTIEKIRHIPQGGYYDDLPDRYKTRDDDGNIVKRYGTYLRRLDPNEPSLTINTNPFIHPTEDRYLTPREMARLQTFPDTFKFSGNKGDVIQQIANAVPVELGRQFGKTLIE